MNWINKLEHKFGRFAIKDLSKYIIGTYIIGYIFKFISPDAILALTLNPYRILHGEVWRIVTWLLIPPESFNIFTIIMLFFYYSLGTTLERTWGSFRYNLYIFSGILMTIIGAFVLYFIYAVLVINGTADASVLDFFYQSLFVSFSTYYINLSIFLAFAAIYPDMQVMLYFVIPLKIKWLAYLDILLLLWEMVRSNWAGRVVIIVSLLNFILFFLSSRNFQRITPREIHRKRKYTKQVHDAGITKHKCAVCGRTEDDDENLEFRFCSKCNGNYEYCQEHLFTHEHIK